MVLSVRRRLRACDGWSLIELLVAIAVVGIAGGVGIAQVDAALVRAREVGAVRLVAARVRSVRVEAVQRSRSVALQFLPQVDRDALFRLCVDGDGDGVKTRDLEDGVDRALGEWEVLGRSFAGMAFGVPVAAPGIETDDDPIEAGGDPLRLGSSNLLTFGADGVGASGTMFLRSGRGGLFAVRVHGLTGRVRAFEYLASAGRWTEL